MPRPGRPREFDEDAVLDRVVETFWAQGYHATTMSDLVTASGLGRQSLYNAFGDKPALFRRALERYRSTSLSAVLARLNQPHAGLDDLGESLRAIARGQARPERRGCLLVNSTMELGHGDPIVGPHVQDHVERLTGAYKRLLRASLDAGELAATVDPTAAAHQLVAVTLGVHVMGRSGASERALVDAVESALSGLRSG